MTTGRINQIATSQTNSSCSLTSPARRRSNEVSTPDVRMGQTSRVVHGCSCPSLATQATDARIPTSRPPDSVSWDFSLKSGTAAATVRPPQQKRHRQTTSDIIPSYLSSLSNTGREHCNAARNQRQQTQPFHCRPASADTYHNGLIATRDPLAGTSFTRQRQPTHCCASESSRRSRAVPIANHYQLGTHEHRSS